MTLPRRVPWESRQELSELYEWLYAPTTDNTTRRRALSRMSVYLSSPSCPTFIHLTHTLLAADLLPQPQSPAEVQSMRLTCGMAIVRFVNGMVDPLQTGPFARPVSHLAATLHIPPSLINLRHRATHEDLAPLPILRQAVVLALNYLHTYSFLPLLASTSAAPSGLTHALQLVGRYKRLMKERLKDREVDEDTPRARALRRAVVSLESEPMENVVAALCTTEGFIPLARKKRPGRDAVEPSGASLAIWLPLLSQLRAVNPSITTQIADYITTALTAPVGTMSGDELEADARALQKEHQSFKWTMAVWLVYFWQDAAEVGPLSLSPSDREHIGARLLASLLNGDAILHRTARSLLKVGPALERGWAPLWAMTLAEAEDERLSGLEDVSMLDEATLDSKLAEMEARWHKLDQIHASVNGSSVTRPPVGQLDEVSAKGWRRLTETEWRPCPIGVWASI